MFAIGLLSLLSVGFVTMMAGGGGDDAPEIEQEDDVQVDHQTESGASSQGDLMDSVEDVIGDIVEDVPEVDMQDASDSETSDDDADANDAETPQEPVRPPMGDEYRDPLIVAEALEAQRILDEIAAEEARQPVNLVTVSDDGGGEVDDDLVLAARADDAADTDPSFTVTAPDGDNDIEVRYDEEHTFQIEYNAQTGSVTAALNSNIEGPEGTPQLVRTSTYDADEDSVIENLVWRNTFEGSTGITIDVTPDQIGVHVAQIELINPADTLDFNFDNEVIGNFHLVFQEMEDGQEGDTSTTKRAFIVQTASAQTSLSASEINQITEQGLASTATTNVLAEIYLGNDSLSVQNASQTGGPNEDWISDFINDNPLITSNIEWASIAEVAEEPAQVEPEDGDDDLFGPDAGLDFPTLDFMGFNLGSI